LLKGQSVNITYATIQQMARDGQTINDILYFAA